MQHETGHSQELAHLRAQLDITHALLAAVSSHDPLRSLAARMSTLCRGTALIYDFEGTVVVSTGEAPAQLIWNEIQASNQRELDFEIGRWHVRTRRVALRDGVHVIAIASRGIETLDQIAQLLLDTSERLLGAVHGIQYGASQRDRRDNEQLIAALHDGILAAREHRFWNRLSQFRFTTYTSVRALELAPLEHPSATETHVTQLVSRARSDDLPLLIMLRRVDMDSPATIAAIIPDTPAGEHWLLGISKQFLTGSSAPTPSLSAIPECVREAETALSIARQWGAAAHSPQDLGPVLIDRIDLSTWMLSHVDSRHLRERINRTLAPIQSKQLRETLITYLASGQHVPHTAQSLFLHPNTVRYRIARIEETMGESLTSPFALSNLILAFYPEIIGRRAELEAADTHHTLTP